MTVASTMRRISSLRRVMNRDVYSRALLNAKASAASMPNETTRRSGPAGWSTPAPTRAKLAMTRSSPIKFVLVRRLAPIRGLATAGTGRVSHLVSTSGLTTQHHRRRPPRCEAGGPIQRSGRPVGDEVGKQANSEAGAALGDHAIV